ncbi:hypothetical protein VTK73DRAFT_8960 [Phialemonium thermophilum]|uniref:Cenp-O kinetochore centromere component n=1 Tax=Phialemonium thermophilum TaxID=223376 RepID=A0ABR3Y6E9_9PEZI
MATSLEDEIGDLKRRVDTLQYQLKVQISSLLLSESTHTLVTTHAPASSVSGVNRRARKDCSHQKLLLQISAQRAYRQECLYRTCASVTTFKVHDPDPNAVGDGSVLGIRLEIVRRGRFLRPYYVLLSRPYGEGDLPDSEGGVGGNEDDEVTRRKQYLRVHRHTIPPSIPLGGLAARYLPPPPVLQQQGGNDEDDAANARPPTARRQDLSKFIRALRRELVRYHNRMGMITDLRRAVGLANSSTAAQSRVPFQIVDISPADTEAKQIKIDWADGRVGRLLVDDDGKIIKFVTVGETGRDRESERQFLKGSTSLEDIARRLNAEGGLVS